MDEAWESFLKHLCETRDEEAALLKRLENGMEIGSRSPEGALIDETPQWIERLRRKIESLDKFIVDVEARLDA